MEKTNGFTGDLEFLSNFYKFPFYVPFLGHEIPTLEHGYQALKTTSRKERQNILESENASIAKKRGKKATLREGWDSGFRLLAMRLLVSDKFNNPELSEKLLATGNQQLTELNHWHDNYFGVCKCKNCNYSGKNMLGELLMSKRTSLKMTRELRKLQEESRSKNV